ncbi:MAG: D-sedoheptulose 7-phosphate isomerase [Proteobacteria bacterium]|jgi:D-sedoheptulose 7-phosphate isomerase|nr:D-sedoheptulose 7-phosphate isomerase [Pseudomonadota bacterium]
MQASIITQYTKTQEVFQNILQNTQLISNIEKTVTLVKNCLENGGKVLLCGNGGSAADCQHIAAELIGRFSFNRKALAAIALTTDTSAITAIGNDFSFEEIFSRQVEGLGHKGDVLFGFSTSGRSKNVLKAFEVAKQLGVQTIAFLGQDGRDIGSMADIALNMPSQATPNIQEAHIATGHVICSCLENLMFKG